MATNALTLSADGLEKLKKHEGAIDGLYDDPSGYATYGVGHLVHSTDKWKSLLLDSAQSDALCHSRVKTQWPGTPYETSYLEREAIGCKEYDDLKTKAKERALDTVAQAKFKAAYKDLDETKKAVVKKMADEAVDREVQLLNLTLSDVLQSDVKPFEKAVNDSVTGVTLSQDEFDALVSFAFNVGVDAFKGSTLLKKINENKYRSGNAVADREKAISEVEQAFLAWNKSGGKELDGLTTRRQDEADRFLKQARDEVEKLKATKGTTGSWRLPAQKRGTSMLAAAATRGVRPDRLG